MSPAIGRDNRDNVFLAAEETDILLKVSFVLATHLAQQIKHETDTNKVHWLKVGTNSWDQFMVSANWPVDFFFWQDQLFVIFRQQKSERFVR